MNNRACRYRQMPDLRTIQGFESLPFFEELAPLSPYHLTVTPDHQKRWRQISPVFANQLVRNGILNVQLEKLNIAAGFALKCTDDRLGRQAGGSGI